MVHTDFAKKPVTLSELYPPLLLLHLCSVASSVTLFAARGVGVQLGHVWPMTKTWRMTSVAIDVVLLAAGLSLWILVQHHPLAEPWLATKLVLLVAYIVTGSFALKRAKNMRTKRGFLVLALLAVLMMISIAITRLPLGHITSFL